MAAVRAFVLPLLAAFALDCAAAPFAVRLGAERVALDTPPGFADTLDLASPRLQELGEALTSASNRILLFALTDADLRRFTLGDTPELRRYLLVATPRATERERIGLSQFRDFVAEATRSLGNPGQPADLRSFLDAQPVGQPALVAELRRTPQAVSLLLGTRLADRGGRPVYLLSTTSLLLLKAKALNVSAYTGYADGADADWLRDTTLRWIDELQRLNSH
jgi:hypothetical protein